MDDIEIINQGSLIGFNLISDAAREWFADNVEAEGYQWMGNVLYVDHRFADAIIEGVRDAGLTIN